jgi:hypothetical protein
MVWTRSVFQSGLLAWTAVVGIAHTTRVAAGDEKAATRPDPDGQATRISIGIYIVDIAEIDDAKQTFKADVYEKLRWKDPRLASSEARRKMPLAKVWHPALLILNERSVDRPLPEEVTVDRHGDVEYSQRLAGTFAVPLNLRGFPLDDQVLAFRVACPGYSPAEIELVPDERGGRAEDFSITGWKIGSLTSRSEPYAAPGGQQVAGFNCTLPAHRLAGAYVYQYLIPLTFIVCMSWAPFWMSPDQLGPRQGIAVTAILTVIAYRFVLTNQLLKVAYLTRFDYLSLGCTALVFAGLAEVVVVHRLTSKENPERARKLDVWARAVFPAFYLALIIGVAVI